MCARKIGRPLGFVVLGIVLVLGMVPLGQSQERQLINDTLKQELNPTFQKRNELINGARPPQGAEDEKIMDIAARWYVQRVTMISMKSNPVEMAKLHDALERELLIPMLGTGSMKGNRLFTEKFGKHLAKAFREVFALNFADNRIPILNAALMLPPVARLKQDDVGDLLVELLKDKKKHDAIKVFAAKAMREFFPATMVTEDDDPNSAKMKTKLKRDSERLQALTEFIDRKGPLPADEGEREAIRYLRREAVASLAQVGVPALSGIKKKGAVEGPAAYDLLRVLVKGKGAFEPPPSVSERVEAALGLCQLKNPEAVGYDPSVAVYAVALCFNDYATEYSKDFVNFSGRKDIKKPPTTDTKIPTMPFRIQSERFLQAAKDLVANTRGTSAQADAKKLEALIKPMAEDMKAFNAVGDKLVPYRNFMKTLLPKSGQLYKLKGPQIDPVSLQDAPAAAAAEEK